MIRARGPGWRLSGYDVVTLLAEAARVAGLSAAERRAIAEERSSPLAG